MRSLVFVVLLAGATAWAQNSAPSSGSSSAAPKSQSPDQSHSSAQQPAPGKSTSITEEPVPPNPNLEPPHSDTVNVRDLGNDDSGESSSKDTQIDLSPPANDGKAHPKELENPTGGNGGDITEMHPWDPHKAAKDVEVGDFYFKRKNYVAAEDRYREALEYKDNDATATFRLALCLEKLNRFDEAVQEFQSYLKILPHGPQAEDAKKAIERLTKSTTKAAK